jgi:hypothetical protein
MWLDRNPYVHAYPAKYSSNVAKWGDMMPDFTVKVWCMADVRELVLQHFGATTLELFDRIQPHICKCDIARFMVLYVHGGYYVDMDFIPVNRLDRLPHSAPDHFLVPEITEHDRHVDGQVTNGFAAFAAGHPFLKAFIEFCLRFFEKTGSVPKLEVMTTTGPIALSRFIKTYNAKRDADHGGAHKIKLTPRSTSALIMPITDAGTMTQDYDWRRAVVAYTLWRDGSESGNIGDGHPRVSTASSQVFTLYPESPAAVAATAAALAAAEADTDSGTDGGSETWWIVGVSIAVVFAVALSVALGVVVSKVKKGERV